MEEQFRLAWRNTKGFEDFGRELRAIGIPNFPGGVEHLAFEAFTSGTALLIWRHRRVRGGFSAFFGY
jgi:hypothetical protein